MSNRLLPNTEADLPPQLCTQGSADVASNGDHCQPPWLSADDWPIEL